MNGKVSKSLSKSVYEIHKSIIKNDKKQATHFDGDCVSGLLILLQMHRRFEGLLMLIEMVKYK